MNQAMKSPSATSLPVRRCNLFLFLGGGVSMTALIWSRLTSIPLWLTMNPKNFPALTPKAHLDGFNFMPTSLVGGRLFVSGVHALLGFYF